ncbi:DUF2865 domain-containing protein [Xanthobacter sp. AM11]|uniref:DUF2865 domain-containing protein n=1 Tax=Xanthobacter sp. AM11 TaxID=3380643 RepID=UPI0039BF253F
MRRKINAKGGKVRGNRLVAALVLMAASAVLGLAGAGDARAQSRSMGYAAPAPFPNFFSLLFGSLDRPAHRPARPSIEFVPRTGGPAAERSGYGRGVALAYCVRTCDGRYFPVQGRPASAGDPEALAQCNAFCPAAKMAVYTSADSARGIEVAVSRDGTPYSSLPNAFVYRQRLVDGCTCTGSARIGGLRQIDVLRDPTLKRGDLVMTPEGGRVFAGPKAGPPYRQADFVAPSRFPEMSGEMRARISELQVATR